MVETTWKDNANDLAYIGAQNQRFTLNCKITTFLCKKVRTSRKQLIQKMIEVVQVLVY